jgi:hypothetical protein
MTTDSGEWERTASASSMSQNYFHYALPNKKALLVEMIAIGNYFL